MNRSREREHFIIAIDGISGSGKSSTAKDVAKKLNIAYLDTGAMYRSVTYLCQSKGIPFTDAEAVIKLSKTLEFEFNEQSLLTVNGKAPGNEIRTAQVNGEVSDYCAIPAVREVLVEAQRKLGSKQPTVVEGRDITTVVFKDAPYKYFFWASPEVRAERRFNELKQKGIEANYQEILKNLQTRDQKDSSRAQSPLAQAEDAQLIDTTNMTLQEQTDFIIQQVSEGVPSRN